MSRSRKLSLISASHYFKLIYRGALFIWALLTFILNKNFHTMVFAEGADQFRPLLCVIMLVFTCEMAFRFFPSKTESMGCQKHFAGTFQAREGSTPDIKQINKGVWLAAGSWILLNGIIGGIYIAGVITDGVLILIALFYSVADMICILFFCPFQVFMMKNRCCVTCRIYNWDYLMMFTPLIFIRNPYTWGLVVMAAILFIQWELTAAGHPERFSENCNRALSCARCEEKLCSYKTHIKAFAARRKGGSH